MEYFSYGLLCGVCNKATICDVCVPVLKPKSREALRTRGGLGGEMGVGGWGGAVVWDDSGRIGITLLWQDYFKCKRVCCFVL